MAHVLYDFIIQKPRKIKLAKTENRLVFALGRRAKMKSGGKRHKAPDAVMRWPTKEGFISAHSSEQSPGSRSYGQLAALHPQSGSREQCMLVLGSLSHFYEV